jgi:hypothetical protein
LKLLLDELYPPSIAVGLRGLGIEGVAVVERGELRQLVDEDVFAVAQREKRAVVTDRRYPRGQARTIGALVEALTALAAKRPGDDAASLRVWL